jgi:hypothetical protein
LAAALAAALVLAFSVEALLVVLPIFLPVDFTAPVALAGELLLALVAVAIWLYLRELSPILLQMGSIHVAVRIQITNKTNQFRIIHVNAIPISGLTAH